MEILNVMNLVEVYCWVTKVGKHLNCRNTLWNECTSYLHQSIRFDNFLITTRNPLDRIISWFYYIHPSHPPPKNRHHKRGCQNFALFHCWDTIQELSEVGLDLTNSTSSSNFEIPEISTHPHASNQTVEECRAWAWDAIMGRRQCWHNYYNYNYTYGPLVQEMKRQSSTNNNEVTKLKRKKNNEWKFLTLKTLK